MVDFTKSINNEQMVEALNVLIRHNEEVLASCRAAREESESNNSRRLTELEQVHLRHTERLGDSIRLLGGSPVRSDDEPSLMHKAKTALSEFGTRSSGLKALSKREDQLTRDYVKTVDRYRASDEIVAVVNQLLDESKPLREWLEQEAQRS